MRFLTALVVMAALHAGAVVTEYRISSVPTSPYIDGSTCSNFDAAMRSMPPGALIHIDTGTFETMGSFGWGPKSGQHIIGAGKGLTILKFPSGAVASNLLNHALVIGEQPPYLQTNITVENLTADSNYQPGTLTTLNGVGLNGPGNSLINVDSINTASWSKSAADYQEAWGIVIAAAPWPSADGSTIENCSVSGFTCNFNNDLQSLGLMENNSGRILYNDIDQLGTNRVYGIIPGHDSIITGNRVSCTLGSHLDDSTSVTNDIFSDNQFVGNCFIDWENGFYQGVQFHNNNLTLTNVSGIPSFPVAAFYFHGGNGLFNAANIDISGSMITAATGAWFILGSNMHGVTYHDTIFNTTMVNRFTNCLGVIGYNNYLAGQPYAPPSK